MISLSGLGPRARALFSDIKGPWGPAGDEPQGEDPSQPGGPWGEAPKRRKGGGAPPRQVTSLDEFLRKSRARFGGGGGGGGIALRILRSTIFTFNFAGGPDGFNFSVGNGWMF